MVAEDFENLAGFLINLIEDQALGRAKVRCPSQAGIGSFHRSYFIVVFISRPGLKTTTLLSGTGTTSPVLGLRPIRFLRFLI